MNVRGVCVCEKKSEKFHLLKMFGVMKVISNYRDEKEKEMLEC